MGLGEIRELLVCHLNYATKNARAKVLPLERSEMLRKRLQCRLSSPPEENDQDSADQNAQIETERHMLGVVKIVLHLLVGILD